MESNNAFYQPVRRTIAEVGFALVAPEAKEKASVALPAQNAFSRGAQIIDNVTSVSAKVATFEPSYWRLDGTFVLPVQPERSEMQVGFWGDAMSGADGEFTLIPTITVTFSETQNIPRLGICFDEPANEFASDLEVWVYNSLGALLYHERAADNKKAYFTTEDGIMGASKIVIKLYKTNRPFRFPRVSELDFGVVIKFDNSDIFDLTLVTEGDPKGTRFPNAALNLTIANKGRFDQLDSKSFAQYLYKRQAFEYKHGVEAAGGTKWFYCGAYYLDNWSVSDDTVSFSAVGKAAVLDKAVYYHSTFEKQTVGYWIRSILDRAGFVYNIAPALDISPQVSGFFGNVTYREILAMLTELSACLSFEDRQNSIQFVDTMEDREESDKIDYDNSFKPPDVKLEAYYNGINLAEYSISVKSGQIAKVDFTVNKSDEITVYFSSPLYGSPQFTVTDGFTLTNVAYGTMFMKATLKGTGTATVTVSGDMAEMVRSERFWSAPWRDPSEPVYAYSVDLPMMIVSSGYTELRDWFLTRKFALLQKRLTCDISWRQNPEQEVGDKILVQVNNKKREAAMYTYQQTIEFSGGVLRGKTKTLGEAGTQ